MKRSFFLIALSIILSIAGVGAQTSQYKIQSLFIYNFTKHVKWNTTPSSFTIGILGKSEILNELNVSIKGKQVSGKEIVIKIISTTEEAAQCQIVYVPETRSNELNSIISAAPKNVLIVTEVDLYDKGAGISFVLDNEKLKFKLNPDVLSRNGLQVSSGLVNLAMK